MRSFLARYSQYVLLRAQMFGGLFDEISQKPVPPKGKKGKPVPKIQMKPITSTNLRVEHLDGAKMLLKAGVACQLKEGEECENTAVAAERVASDLIGLSTAVAIALNRALKSDDLDGADPALIKRWCEFYSEELLPKTRAMVKKTSSKLDAYGLFLPSRMGATVSPETLQRGLKADELVSGGGGEGSSATADEGENEEGESKDAAGDEVEEKEDAEDKSAEKEEEIAEEEPKKAAADEEAVADGDEYDEYEYEEEEYYDAEEL